MRGGECVEAEVIVGLVTLILGLVSAFAGAKWAAAKGKAKALTTLLNDVVSAAEDDMVSDVEFQRIVASAKKLME